MSAMISVTHLKKSYGDVLAVDDISFEVQQGELFAFLGPNGAGKSTTVSILCTLLKHDAGEVTVDGCVLGRDDDKIRKSIGVVFQESLLDPLLTVRENILLRGRLYGGTRQALGALYEQASDAAGIGGFAERPYGKLSGGQRRRADIARALIHRPRVLFLDEPTTGLDPQTRLSIWETIRRLRAETGMTVFLTTHYMEEAAGADRVIVIDEGKIAARGTPVELRRAHTSDTLTLWTDDLPALRGALDTVSAAYESYDVSGRSVTVKLRRTVDSVPILAVCGAHVTDLEVKSGTMDDVFLSITGKEIRS
ncbi:MAG: ABC transporter ATP-binding protein [Oscillospiraceae bacterium]|jgi:multidrug/hemolysin transport system ATP-binding protein|nr:ABC transporter ATP-binding protein [Oscillospiraceae bacterium]